MLEFVKEIKNFSVDLVGMSVNATELYATDEDGNYRLLVPDSIGDDGRVKYLRILWVNVHELSSDVDVKGLRKIALENTPKPSADRGYNISQNVYIFVIENMIGTFRSRRVGKDIFLFFSGKKLGENQSKFRAWKIVGRLLTKRASGIVESTKKKIGKEPWGPLKTIVEHFTRLGEKMVKLAEQNIVAIRSNSNKYNSNKECASYAEKGAASDAAPSASVGCRTSSRQLSLTAFVSEVARDVEAFLIRRLISSNALRSDVVVSVVRAINSRVGEMIKVCQLLGG